MPLRTAPMEDPQINFTPMVDVVLNLVIFFMLGTQFIDRERQYAINLPQVSDAQPLTSGPDEIVVNLNKQRQVYIGSKEYSLEVLQSVLTERHGRYADQAVVVRGDESVDYQSVMTILNICQRAGIGNIQLANKANGP